jgi:hypothetical protein
MTLPPSSTPEDVAPLTQDEIARQAIKDGYRIHQGLYSNHEYGFSVLIPEGYLGIKDPEPNPAHGFRIILSKRPEAEIRAYANYDAANYNSLDEAVNAQLKSLETTGNGTEITVLRREPMMLENLTATRIVTRHREKVSGAIMIQDIVTSIRWETYEGVEEPWVLYILLLKTPETRYSGDNEVFEQVIKAWSTRPLKR